MRVVATLTTMPDRYNKVVRTIESLRNQSYQLDEIYLGLPKTSRRLKIDYPPATEDMLKICTIVECTDFGPITKLLGGILSEDDPNTIIISFDDDMIYPNTIVESLVNHHKVYPNSAIGSSGMLLTYSCPMCAITPNEDNFLYRISKFSVPDEGRKVDSIYGYPGALYVRKFFPSKDNLEQDFLNYSLIDDDMFMNDDIVISGYLSLQSIDRRIFPNMPPVDFVYDNGVRVRTDNEISYNLDKFFQRMNRSIEKCKSLNMYSTTESVYMSETIIGIIAIVIISIIIMLVLIYFLIYTPIYKLSI